MYTNTNSFMSDNIKIFISCLQLTFAVNQNVQHLDSYKSGFR